MAATDCDRGANDVNAVSDRVELLPLPCNCSAWCAAAAAAARYSAPVLDDVVEDGSNDGIEVAAAAGADPMPMLDVAVVVVVVVVVLVCCRSTPETIAPK